MTQLWAMVDSRHAGNLIGTWACPLAFGLWANSRYSTCLERIVSGGTVSMYVHQYLPMSAYAHPYIAA